VKRIFLIEPPQSSKKHARHHLLGPYAPLWALCLANYLRLQKPSVDVKILDSQILSWDKIINEIQEAKPEFVGISPTLFSYECTLELARVAKANNAKVILGGHQATGLAKEILKNRGPYSKDYCIDAVIKHDGEKALCEYIQEKELSEIKNLVYQTKDGIKENPIESLDLLTLPEIKRDFVDMEEYFRMFKGTDYYIPFKRPINIYTQRGCAWREQSKRGCVFCSRMELNLRLRDPKLVVKEIKSLIKEHKVDCLREFSDDFLGAGPQWMKEFEKEYSQIKDKPLFEACVRADRITEDSIEFLKKINIYRCALGIESFSDKSLAWMRKGISVKQNKKAIELLDKNNIAMSFCIILGIPGETKESVQKTVDFIQELIDSKKDKNIVYFNIRLLTPMPNSLCWDWLIEKTGDKYKDKDIIDRSEMRHDWFKNFCKVTNAEFKDLLKILVDYQDDRFKFMTGIKEIDD
jgi:radical SAM superfamily enzyme YgiQ (UPF0313 family)